MRADGRKQNEMRPLTITRNYLKQAEGSVLIEMGETKVLCTATVEETVPSFLRGKKKGWVTAEYAMLPRSSKERIPRESSRGKVGGRTHEIQRLIGRSLRAVIDMATLGERTILIDCDVISADGGTRTAAITGAFIALMDALVHLQREGKINEIPIRDYLAAISVGKVNGQLLLDLNYREDSTADVDMNVVMTGSGALVEVQATAEERPFGKKELDGLLGLASGGIKKLVARQRKLLGEALLPKVVIATHNPDKGKELRTLLGEGLRAKIYTLADLPGVLLPEETGKTYQENAAAKAKSVARATGFWALGDDSGLEIEALSGAPGLFSARFSGEKATYADNRRKVLDLLKGLPNEKRGAKFVCALALASPAGDVFFVEESCEGVISQTDAGSGGFGYDPLFFVPSLNQLFSDLSMAEKNKISHRGKATRSAIEILKKKGPFATK